MDDTTRWETEALRSGSRRASEPPRPSSKSERDGTAATPGKDPEMTAPRSPSPPPDTMIVPLDAWNTMLNQLGNLHEAGQQLAEARERAAKAETEATFLRERLAEMRMQNTEHRTQNEDGSQSTVHSSQPQQEGGRHEEQDVQGDDRGESTTSYWRYLTFGWRERKRKA